MLKITIFVFLFSICIAEKRKVSLYLNPGCSSECHGDKQYLIHVTADGSNDTLHHIWDFTYKPTVILCLTPLNTSLSIDWPEFLKGQDGSIIFSTPPKSVFSFVINQIIEFNDVNNSATYDPSKFNESDVVVHDTYNFQWKLDSSKIQNSSDLAAIIIEGKEHHEHKKLKGSIIVSVSAFGTLDHSITQPHLFHTVNASQIDVVLDRLSTSENFNSRFALGLTMASQENEEPPKISERKSLDDEHAPGVFTIGEVKMSPGYLMWRSVAYTSKERLMTSSTVVSPALSSLSSNDSFNHTAFSSLFGNQTKMLLISSVFSFGQQGEEDYYPKTNYLSWTFLGGVGKTAEDSYSLLVELITIFGIGLPAALIILAVSCIVVKRISRQSHDIVFAER